mmetsp:Transcript_138186/g.243824  ORF Transcript_138186/g.243824 Transcript_138186/m.243824 type:complete len:232 (+) Transcript_138186:839-1534(+)
MRCTSERHVCLFARGTQVYAECCLPNTPQIPSTQFGLSSSLLQLDKPSATFIVPSKDLCALFVQVCSTSQIANFNYVANTQTTTSICLHKSGSGLFIFFARKMPRCRMNSLQCDQILHFEALQLIRLQHLYNPSATWSLPPPHLGFLPIEAEMRNIVESINSDNVANAYASSAGELLLNTCKSTVKTCDSVTTRLSTACSVPVGSFRTNQLRLQPLDFTHQSCQDTSQGTP